MQGLCTGTYVRMRLSGGARAITACPRLSSRLAAGYAAVRTTPVAGVPCELVVNHDPARPLVLGGLGQGEEKTGVMRLRLKRHRLAPARMLVLTTCLALMQSGCITHGGVAATRCRWFPKVLKTRDPLVFSAGWRRWQVLQERAHATVRLPSMRLQRHTQTGQGAVWMPERTAPHTAPNMQGMPVFALEDHNRRLRALKYSPEHMHCTTALWGPLLPPNTGGATGCSHRCKPELVATTWQPSRMLI